MVRKLHRVAGVLSFLWLFLLTLSGLLLNHEKNLLSWDFLWRWEVPISLFHPDALKAHANRDITSLLNTKKGLFIGAMTGFYDPSGKRLYKGRVFKLEPLTNEGTPIALATDDGIKIFDGKRIKDLTLTGQVVTSLSVNYPKAIAVIKKRELYLVDLKDGSTLPLPTPQVAELPEKVRLGRFVRDFHYGRGLLTQPLSAYLNDLFSLALLWSTLTGFVLFFVRKLKGKRKTKRLLYRLHGTKSLLLTLPFVFLLLLTGLFINRWELFLPLMRAEVPLNLLPPAYRSPHTDIWDVDYDGRTVRIATRVGLYRLDAGIWRLECEGFAYKLRRFGEKLYISGMGAPNRVLTKEGCEILTNTPHMPVDFVKKDGKVVPVVRNRVKLERSSLPLYTFLLSLHDTSAIGYRFLLLNDITALLSLFLCVSALYLWGRRLIRSFFSS
ncbi:MAG: hypothetical protein GXO04_00240 [Aquificae bacterium]|nr:hypothetical protein [Aquificota bacterium]